MDEKNTKKVIIDAYRGGDDVGNSINGIIEKDYNLDLSKYIYKRLKELGVLVFLTRVGDETLSLDDRVNKIKMLNGDLKDVIILSNTLANEGNGAKIVYALRNGDVLSKKIADSLGKSGLSVNKYFQRRLPSDTSKDYYQLIRDTGDSESIIVYYGNINNKDEATFLKNNLESICEAVVYVLSEYLNINYSPNSLENYYVVKKGDTLYSIASNNKTTVDKIKNLNNLTSDNLSIGQLLKLSDTNEDSLIDNNEFVYIVKKGDTLYKIAKTYGSSVGEIKKLNNLLNDILTIGQKLLIPSITSDEDIDKYFIYKVISGDSLYSLARRYKTTVDELKVLNNITSNLLSIGQILKIPKDVLGDDKYFDYVVEKGDSLYSIARRYKTTVDELKALNNITSNLLSIGQILKIPN